MKNSFSLPKRLIDSHWALDVGISKVVDKVAEILDCTAIKANYSRLIIDLNRQFEKLSVGSILKDRSKNIIKDEDINNIKVRFQKILKK